MNPNAVNFLKANVAALPAKDQGFALSLVQCFEAKGALSDKQQYWVVELGKRLINPAQSLATVDVGNFEGVLALFAQAKSHLKNPKIALKTDKGLAIHLSIAGPNSKAPGTINVTDDKPHGMNKWFGRVTAEGKFQPSTKFGDLAVDLTSILTALSLSPAKTAAAYGKLTGTCCFCLKGLTDPKSVQVGYGPTCAEHYGLPWGASFKKAA
jgi:hypothetical protein